MRPLHPRSVLSAETLAEGVLGTGGGSARRAGVLGRGGSAGAAGGTVAGWLFLVTGAKKWTASQLGHRKTPVNAVQMNMSET